MRTLRAALRGLAAGLLWGPAAAWAGMDDPGRQAAIQSFGEVMGVVDRDRLSKEELTELAQQYAALGFTEEELQAAPRLTQERMDSVDKGLPALQALNRELDRAVEASDMEAYVRLTKEREALRISLSRDHSALVELQKTLRSIWKRSEYIAVAGILTRKPSAKDFLAMERTQAFHGKVTKYYEMVRSGLAQDDELQKRRQARLDDEHARKLQLLFGAAALLVLVPAGVWFRRRRRTLRLPTDTLPIDPADNGLLAGVYRVDRQVGQGAMGVVYEALDVALNRRVALKRVRDELRANPRELQLLLAEAQTVAALKHPCIVEIFNIVQDRGEVYLAFEFVDGATLAAVLAERKRLTLAQTVGVAAQVASAVDFAHAHKVIHRDLKPANVMVARDGRAKVMDFGVAHQVADSAAKLSSARSWGTPAYMAPEQELGQVSKAADIFAVAACCYEMLTGALPFSGPDFLAQKQQGRFTPARSLAPELPAHVDEALKRGLAAAPQARFISASALVAALKGAAQLPSG
ncbi:serine/threonine protein kinase [bacterium]|nr:MAG: serine/threonine protein kinase [bacterium]